MKILNSLFLKSKFNLNVNPYFKSTMRFSINTVTYLQSKTGFSMKSPPLEIINSESPLDSHSLIVSPPPGIDEWAHKYFPKDKKLTLPIFDFNSNTYTGENAVLEQEVFNEIVRRDLIHRVLVFNKSYNRKTHKWVMSKGDVSGSNRKPFRQKKTGRAPQGDIRAPNLYHGGRAHGARPRNYYFPLNKKIRLFGLKSAMTSKFLENRIILINSEKIETPKINSIERNLKFLKENRSLFITSSLPCENFSKAVKQIQYATHKLPGKINVDSIINCRYIIFTKEGLSEFIQTVKDRHTNYFRNKKILLDPINARKTIATDKFVFDFDPEKNLVIHTPALKGSLEAIESHYKDPQKKKQEILDRREQDILDAEKAREERRQKEAENMYSDNSAVERRRAQLKRERKMKMQKELKKQTLKKKKQQDVLLKKQQEQVGVKKKK